MCQREREEHSSVIRNYIRPGHQWLEATLMANTCTNPVWLWSYYPPIAVGTIEINTRISWWHDGSSPGRHVYRQIHWWARVSCMNRTENHMSFRTRKVIIKLNLSWFHQPNLKLWSLHLCWNISLNLIPVFAYSDTLLSRHVNKVQFANKTLITKYLESPAVVELYVKLKPL